MRCDGYFSRIFTPALSTLVLTLFFWSSVQAELVLTAPPRETAEKGERVYGPLAAHLTKLLGETVTYMHPGTWLHYQQDMQADKYDIIFDGPHFMSWRMKKHAHTPLVRLPGELSFVMIVSSEDNGIETLGDLANEEICAISPPNLSTMTMIAAFGNQKPTQLKAVKGGMRGVYKAFKKFKCRAAILRNKFYQTKLTVNDKAHTRVIFKSKPVANQGITVSARVDKEMRVKIVTSLLEKNSGTFPIFRRFSPGVEVMMPATADDYQEYYKLLTGAPGW